ITTSWFALPVESAVDARMPPSVPSATEVCGVEVSIPRTSIGTALCRGPGPVPWGQDLAQPLPSVGPARALPLDHEVAVLLPFPVRRDRQLHPQVGLGQQRLDPVAPLDQHHALLVQQLVEAQVEDVLDPVQSVEV